VLPNVVPAHLPAHLAAWLTAGWYRLRDERGQTSAEYALVLLGAASVALLVIVWARNTDQVGRLLDTMFRSVSRLADDG
jgi:Flp pilus assembly pilin Flp